MTVTPWGGPQRSSPRPRVWATESPTIMMRFTGGGGGGSATGAGAAVDGGAVSAVASEWGTSGAVGPVTGSVPPVEFAAVLAPQQS